MSGQGYLGASYTQFLRIRRAVIRRRATPTMPPRLSTSVDKRQFMPRLDRGPWPWLSNSNAKFATPLSHEEIDGASGATFNTSGVDSRLELVTSLAAFSKAPSAGSSSTRNFP